MAKKGQAISKNIEAFKHGKAKRKNIPTAEYEALVQQRERTPIRVAYERRNRDLDPQLVWRGKESQSESDLIVSAAPLYIQEKIHPKALIDDLRRETRERQHAAGKIIPDLFSDFNGIPIGVDKTEFYLHDQNWSNRMILGDSLQVMASLAEREGLRSKVQCIFFDPPYGIKFNSNFQWSTTSRDVKDGNAAHITREPEQVKAFRDTWRDGIHSYLSYLRDRLTVARDLLAESGSVFIQIGDENVHRVRAVLDEVFGPDNFVSQICYRRAGFQTSGQIPNTFDYILWFRKKSEGSTINSLLVRIQPQQWFAGQQRWLEKLDGTARKYDGTSDIGPTDRLFSHRAAQSATPSASSAFPVLLNGREYHPSEGRGWSTSVDGYRRLRYANRLLGMGSSLRFKPYYEDFPVSVLTNGWTDTVTSGFGEDKIYVVQTASDIVERCILMATNPGDLVLDPTCGSGTTAYVAEKWGRRWITIDTSRVALALARSRLMGARYPYFLLADSREGQLKEAELLRTSPSSAPTHGEIRHGFVNERVPHITLKAIANNAEIDVIWEKWEAVLEPLRETLNTALGQEWSDWELPRDSDSSWPVSVRDAHGDLWKARVERQKEIDASINAKAEPEYLYDRAYDDKKTVRVAGPFTVESLDPHRNIDVDENDELIDPLNKKPGNLDADQIFVSRILESLRSSGVQQADKQDKIVFTSLTPWQGDLICGDGRYIEGSGTNEKQRRAAIFIGPEFGTVTRSDLVEAAREAGEGGYDVLIACAFSYEAYATDFEHLGRLRILKARMNADLHMSADLKNTGKGNLFVIFGEPDIDLLPTEDEMLRVKINGVDVFHPSTGEVRSDGPQGIACWFIDTDYNSESFFVRHAYFLGANDQYGSLKTTLKAEIDKEAWGSLHSDVSRSFPRPKSGRIAVKVINHLGDEVMKIFKIS